MTAKAKDPLMLKKEERKGGGRKAGTARALTVFRRGLERSGGEEAPPPLSSPASRGERGERPPKVRESRSVDLGGRKKRGRDSSEEKRRGKRGATERKRGDFFGP